LGYIFFSSNRIEILFVRPENESNERKVAYFLANSVVFAQKSDDIVLTSEFWPLNTSSNNRVVPESDQYVDEKASNQIGLSRLAI
jgi:hypothetical protein